MRLDVPRFSGENALAWISRIQRYFEFYNTPDPQRLLTASFHLDGAALDRYDWMSKNQLFDSWGAFFIAVEKRFGPSVYEDSFGKMTNTGTLVTCQQMFEQLANKIPGVSVVLLRGFEQTYERRSKFYKPQSLVQAMGLAKLFEDNSLNTRLSPKLWGEAPRSDNSHGFSRVPPLPPLLPTPSFNSYLQLRNINFLLASEDYLPVKW